MAERTSTESRTEPDLPSIRRLTHPCERVARFAARALHASAAFVAMPSSTDIVIVAAVGAPLTAGTSAPWQRVLQAARTGDAPVAAQVPPSADATPESQAPLSVAAAAAHSPDGSEAVVCVFEHQAREWTAADRALLADAAVMALSEIALQHATSRSERADAQCAALLDSPMTGVCGIDADGCITFVNARLAELLGWTPQELAGQPLSTLQHASADADTPNADLLLSPQLIMRAERPLRGGVAALRHRDGGAVHVEFSASAMRHGDGATGAVITMLDMTDRRLVEDEMREGEERYRRLVEQLPDALALVLNGRITFANPAAVRLTESSSAVEMIGRRITDFLPDDVRDRIDRMMRLRDRRGAGLLMETTLVRADGSQVPVDVSAVPLMIRGQRGAQVVVRDLSERRAAAAALHRSEEQLRQSQKMEAIGRLAGGIAHDFNNILTAIRGFATLLDPEGETDTLRRLYIEEILKASDRAATLTRQLLAFGRRQVLSPVVLDVNATIRDMAKMIQRLIGEDVDLALNLADEAGRVMADPGQLEQVLMNLVVNARDAMENGGKLTVETRNTWLDETYSQGRFALVPGRYVLIAVSDTGSGMDAATLDRAFEPFFTTKPPNRGTGLGLSTVYGIVKQSGGFVWAYSEPGSGTTMKVYLPRVDADACSVPEPEQPQLRPGGTETLLLVEDEPAVRLLTRTLLVQRGYNVLEAANGDGALQLAAAYDGVIHLLLTDVVMPRMGGRELADRLLLVRPDVKVVYVSGYAEHAIARHGILEEGCVLLQKPFTPDALLAVVQAALAR